jgi:hypothetical protein
MFGFAPNPFNWQKPYSLVQDYWTREGAGSTGTVMDDNIVVGTHPTSKGQAILNTIKSLRIVVDVHHYFGIPLSSIIAEGRASDLPHDSEEVQRHAVRLSASAEVDRRCEENEHFEVI